MHLLSTTIAALARHRRGVLSSLRSSGTSSSRRRCRRRGREHKQGHERTE